MSTALAIHTQSPAAVARGGDVDFSGIWQMAEALVPTGFLPAHIRTPGQAAAIILTGREMGMGPMRALRSLNMVKGKVTESADSQLARFKVDGGKAKWLRLDEHEAKLWLRHPNGDEHTETFTMEDARRAGLAGEGGMYQKHPKAMLRSRAITAGIKSVGWEGGVGTYDPDELPTDGPAVEEPAPLSGLDQARAYILPGKPGAWGGKAGNPLGELDPKLLRRIVEWIDAREEPSAALDELKAHIGLVLAHHAASPDTTLERAREAAAMPDPYEEPASMTQGTLVEEPAPVHTAQRVDMPAPGRVQDAFFPNEEPPRRRRSAQSEGH